MLNTKKITIEPVTRIEGHAKVTIHLNDSGTVEHAYLHINEFRGFEKFCEGRPYAEMPAITPRICGICPVSHHWRRPRRPMPWPTARRRARPRCCAS
jgi:NAD-reducing hydrogenase large subunit